jgi:hypothetical protein
MTLRVLPLDGAGGVDGREEEEDALFFEGPRSVETKVIASGVRISTSTNSWPLAAVALHWVTFSIVEEVERA